MNVPCGRHSIGPSGKYTLVENDWDDNTKTKQNENKNGTKTKLS